MTDAAPSFKQWRGGTPFITATMGDNPVKLIVTVVKGSPFKTIRYHVEGQPPRHDARIIYSDDDYAQRLFELLSLRMPNDY
jgi:hypothetical protein